ncbi:hypothetical protein BAE44_0000163, partial [Dichanthelium oligosanthes]
LAARRVLFQCKDAEATACLEGIKLASRWPDTHISLESDCAGVVEKLKAKQQDRSLLWPLIKEALEEGRLLHGFEVHMIGREQNKVAHGLAQLAIRSREGRVYFSSFPDDVMSLACNDIS